MLEYKAFKKLFMEELNQRKEESEHLDFRKLYKVNQQLDALVIMKQSKENRNTAGEPVFYLNDLFNAYLNGQSIDSLVSEVLMKSEMDIPKDVMMHGSLTLETLKTKIYPQIINREHNRCFLEYAAYTTMPGLDLAVIYRMVFSEDQNGSMSSIVPWELIREWEIPVEELHEIALHNMEENRTYQIGYFPAPPEIGPMIYLSDDTSRFGAAQVLSNHALKIAEEIFEGSFFILPSSLHEVVLLKYVKEKVESYKAMVREINREVVSPEDWLSDQVYYYDAEDKQVKMAA